METTNNVSGTTNKAKRYKTAIIDPPWSREQGGTFGANRPRSIFTWIKLRVGLGIYLRNCTEHVLLGTRGKAPVLCN